MSKCRHYIQLYETDAFLIDALGEYFGSAIGSGGAGVVIATRTHREQLALRMETSGLDARSLSAAGRYIEVDAADLLASITVKGSVDQDLFAHTVGHIISQAAESGTEVHVFGEMLGILLADGNHAAAIALERLWNDLQAVHSFTLCCGYSMRDLAGVDLADAITEVWAQHALILPTEGYAGMTNLEDRFHAIALLQQKAASLDSEVVARRHANDRFRFLAESMPQKIFTARPNGQVDYFNRQWTEFTGLPFEEILNWGWTQFIHPSDVDENVRLWQHSIDTGESFQFEHRFRRHDGEYRWHLSRAHPMRDSDGSVMMWIGSNTDIHDQKRTEEALRASEERFKAAFSHAAIGMALTDLHGRFLHVNAAYCEITGYSESELYQLDFTTITHADDRERNLRLINQLLTGDIPSFVMEKRYLCKDRRVAWVQMSVSLLRDGEGTPSTVVALVEDISERKRGQESMARSARLTALSADVGRALTDRMPFRERLQRCADALVVHLDGAFARIWTLNEAEAMLYLQASAGMYTHLDGPHGRIPVGTAKIGRIAQTRQPHLTNRVVGDPEVNEQEWAKREGITAFAGYPLLTDERLAGVAALFARHPLDDITLQSIAFVSDSIALAIERQKTQDERDRAQAEAEAQRARLHALFMEAPAAIAVYRGPDYVVELMNPICRKFFADRIEVGRPLFESMPELANSPTRDMLDGVYATGETLTVQEGRIDLDRGNGSLEPAYFTFITQPFHGPSGEVEGIVGFGLEVTDQVQARRAVEEAADNLTHQQQWLESLLNLLPVPILLIEPETARVYFSNRAADEMAGGTFPKAESSTEYSRYYYCTDAQGVRIPDDQMPGVRAARGERLRGFEMNWHTPDRVIAVLLQSETLGAMHGHPETVIVAFDDVTRLKEVEAALNTAIRSRDEFLSAASHDLKNPLAVLQGQAQLLKRRANRGILETPHMINGLEIIENRSRAMTSLIDDLLDVTRLRLGQDLELLRQEVDLVSLVRDVVAERQHIVEARRLRLEVSRSELLGEWDRSRLVRVFENLINNALKYSPEGGEIVVSVGAEETAQGETAVVIIKDEGMGIPVRDLPYIFERFYRAENVTGKIAGTGIGLAGARQIVEKHGGTIVAESSEGEGSTFIVRLPINAPDERSSD